MILNRRRFLSQSLMASAFADYTEIMVLKETTGSLKLSLFLPLVTVPQVVAFAWLLNSVAA